MGVADGASDGNNNLDKLRKISSHDHGGGIAVNKSVRTVLVVVLVKLLTPKPSRWYVPALHIFTYNTIS